MKIYRMFDRFCARNERYGIKNLMIYIVAGNVIVFLLSMIDPRGIIPAFLSFDRYKVLQGQVWRLLTYVIVPRVGGGAFGAFLFAIMLYFYYTIGKVLESRWGSLKLTIFYFLGTLITSVFAILLRAAADASYINLTLFLAFATLYPDMRVMFFFVIPIRIKYLAYFALGLELLSVVVNFRLFPANMLPLAALLNYALFFLPFISSLLRSARYRRSDNVINFKQAKRQAEKQYRQAQYRHKCEVCGKTDTAYPDLEFRYCSKCSGYHCYCQDHISTHVHVV